MSRPDGAAASEPRVPRAGRTVHRRAAPVTLRVVSERVPTRGGDGASVGDPATGGFAVPAAPAPPRADRASGATLPGAVAQLERGPLATGAVVGLPGPADRALPVLDPRVPRRRLARLMDVIRFRRGAAGRHRPDTTPSRAWSMFAPHRRDRRRFGVRR